LYCYETRFVVYCFMEWYLTVDLWGIFLPETWQHCGIISRRKI